MSRPFRKYKGVQIWTSCFKAGSKQRSIYVNYNSKKVRFYYDEYGEIGSWKKAFAKAKEFINKNIL